MLSYQKMLQGCGAWCRTSGPENDVVISSRVRLARNLAAYPFMSQVNELDRTAIQTRVQTALQTVRPEEMTLFEMEKFSLQQRMMLVERHLISGDLALGEGSRSVAISENESLSVMICEEDHLRIQSLVSGFDLSRAWDIASSLESQLAERLSFAVSEEFGYLTACPSNVGTAMRVSVMLHLPALQWTSQMGRVIRGLQKVHLTMRGLYGENSQAHGDLFQISNRVSLGQTEAELLALLNDVVPDIVEYERKARSFFAAEEKNTFTERIDRALGMLTDTEAVSTEEAMNLLSTLRVGTILGVVKDFPLSIIDRLFQFTQPAHLQQWLGSELEPTECSIERARYLREHLLWKKKSSI